MSLHVQILNNESGEHGAASFLVFSDAQRFLINASEGTQRFAVEHGVRLSRCTHLVLSSPAWSHVGGVPGLLLTVADHGVPQLRVAAPRGFARSLVAARSFLHRSQLTLDLHLFAKLADAPSGFERPLFADTAVQFFAVPLAHAALRERGHRVVFPLNGAGLAQLRAQCDCAAIGAAERFEQRAVAIIVHGAEIAGKFDAARALALGVPAGPLRGALVRGESVTSPSTGLKVAPADCISPPSPGRVAVICTATTPDEMLSLVGSAPLAARYHAGGAFAELVVVVLHTAPRDVFLAPAYCEWRARFAPHVEQRWAHADAGALCRLVPFVSSALYQKALHAVAPAVFRAYAGDDGALALLQAPAETRAALELVADGVRAGTMLSRFVMAPLHRLGAERETAWSAVDARRAKQHKFADMSAPSHVPEHAARRARVAALLEQMRGNAHAPLLAADSTLRADNPALTFLGTGSALPSKCRNVTCILVRMSPQHSMLLDCGEGSLGQLRRALDAAAVDDVLRSLSCIWLSHRHPDHHLGVESVLAARRAVVGAAAPPLLVVAPHSTAEWLGQFAEPIELVLCDAVLWNAPRGAAHALVAARCGLEALVTVPVQHIGDSFGIVLRHAAWSVAFSGDTTPCAAFVEAARGVTALIHEATLEDGMEADALSKNHTTTSQALQVASDARAQYVVLTHFSQRYPRVPSLPASAHAEHVVVSFDLMTVFLDQLRAVPLLTPVLTELLEEAHDADDAESGSDNDDGDGAQVKRART